MSDIKDVKQRGIMVELDKPRKLKYDLNSFGELEELYGTIDAAMDAMEKGSIKALRIILWAGLIHEEMDEDYNPKIRIKEVASWVTPDRLEEIMMKVTQAMEGDLPEPDESQKAEIANKRARKDKSPDPTKT